MFKRCSIAAVSALALWASVAQAQSPARTTPAAVDPVRVAAAEAFLAGDALRGRGSATPDEAVAAAWVAARFQDYGLQPAPGMSGYIQTAGVVRVALTGRSVLTVGDVAIREGEGLTLFSSAGVNVSGPLTVTTGDDPAAVPAATAILITDPDPAHMGAWVNGAADKGAKLVLVRENAMIAGSYRSRGRTRTPTVLADEDPADGRPEVVYLSPAAFDRLQGLDGQAATFDLGGATRPRAMTSNAVGFLPGTDPAAGVLLISAHLDHLGVRPDGVIMHGANDDASGVTAVLELARTLSTEPHRRGILFVAYGSEEIGGLGSQYFGAHSPVPLTDIVANLEIEMIGAQDPKMPDGVMMMTGFERSDFGSALKERGALIAPDMYPEQNFFQRSDNYQLALQGVVAHTISGWAVTPTYHSPDDDIAHLDIPFMTRAIQSLVEPLRWLASSDFKPSWAEGGRPQPR